MNLKTIFTYKTDRSRPVTIQRRALRLLAGFLVFMLACTLLSRAADSLTVAQVTTEKPARAAIPHTVEKDGRLEPAQERPVTAEGGILVGSVAVGEGQQVKAGDLLFTLDADDLARQVLEKQLELQRAQLQLQEAQQKAALGEEKDELSALRAQEDYDMAMERSRLKLQQAGEDRRRARQALRDYKNDNDVDEDEDDEDLDPTYIALRDDYRAKQRAYEEALSDQDRAKVDAERVLEDLELEDPDNSAATLGIDVRLRQLELSRLQALSEAGGEIYAPIDGAVTALSVAPGKRTADEAALLLAGAEVGFRFTCEITDDEREYLSPGDKVKLELPGHKRADGTVESIAALADKNGFAKVMVSLPAGKGEAGMSAVLSATTRSEQYRTTVPVSALHKEGEQYYVLAVRETESVLGVEQSAERLDVTLLDRNETTAAVEGPLTTDDRIITGGNKTVRENDRVRPEAT